MRLARLVAEFFVWWGRELADIVPARLRAQMVPGRRLLAVYVTADAVVVTRWIGSRKTELFRRAGGDPALPAADAVGAAIRRGRGRGFDVVLCPGDGVLRTELPMPVLPEAAMRRALQYQIDRLTPFTAGEVHFDFRTLRVDPAARRVVVDLAVVPRKRVDALRRRAAEWGAPAAAVAVGDPDGPSPPEFDLTRSVEEARDGRSGSRGLNAGLAVALGLLLIVLALSVLDQRRTAADALAAEVETARRAAHEASALQADIDRRGRDLSFFADRKARRPMAVAVLLEVTRVMPDHTWLTEFQVRDDEVQVAGYASAASDLIARVETSAMFREARFRSPITHDPATGKERFNLTFRVAGPGDEGS